MGTTDYIYQFNKCIGVSVVSALVTHPIDVMKVRIQTNTVPNLTKLSDVVSLTNGMRASILRNTTFIGCKMFAYETIKSQYELKSFNHKILAGCVAGSVGCLVGTPFDKVMVQLQNNPQKNSIMSTFLEEYRRGGMFEFWKGTKYTFLRTITVTVCQFAVYDQIKEFLEQTTLKGSSTVFIVSSVCASASAAVLSNPFDLCKTRAMINSTHRNMSDIVRHEGFLSLWKGTVANASRQIPLHFVRFFLLEYLNSYNSGFTKKS